MVAAHHALVEGDAVNTQDIFIERHYTPSQIRNMIAYEQSLPSGPSLPWAIKDEFYFPYTTGLTFTQTLYHKGGMAAINKALSNPPSSTYEVMFPSAYEKGWHPVQLPLHSVTGFPGWKQVDDDVFGAYGYDLLIQHDTNAAFARDIVQEYRGDRYVFLEHGSKNLLLMRSVWADSGSATSARNALANSIRARFPGKTSWTAAHTVLTDPSGAVFIRASGSNLTLAYAPNASLARKLGTAKTS